MSIGTALNSLIVLAWRQSITYVKNGMITFVAEFKSSHLDIIEGLD